MTCAAPESFARGRPALTTFFSLIWEELSKYHYKRAIFGPPAKRHLNGVLLACRLWPKIESCLDSFTILRGSEPVLLKNLYIFYFRGGGSGPPVPPLDPHMFDVLPFADDSFGEEAALGLLSDC